MHLEAVQEDLNVDCVVELAGLAQPISSTREDEVLYRVARREQRDPTCVSAARLGVQHGQKQSSKGHSCVTMRRGDAVEASEGATVHLRMSRTQRRPAGVVSSSETRNKIARNVVRVESMLTRGIPNPLESRGPVGSQRCKRVFLLS